MTIAPIVRPLLPALDPVARGGALPWEGAGSAAAWSLDRIGGLLALYDNRDGASAAQSTIADRSVNGRNLTTVGSPVPLPRCLAFNAQPAIAFIGASSQAAQDQAGDAATYWTPLHQAGIGVILRVQIRDQQSGATQILGNSNNLTSNINALSLHYDGVSAFKATVTSTTGGGTTHVNATTAADVRPGDVCTVVFLHRADKTWSLEVIREPRIEEDSRRTLTVTGSYASTINAAAPAHALTLASRGTLSGVFATCRIYAAAVFTIGASTTDDVSRAKDLLAARTGFEILAPDYSNPLVGAGFAGAGDYADGTHHDDDGHAKIAARGVDAEQSIATALGWTGAKNRAVIGDSRPAGTGASAVGTTDMRAKIAAGPYSGGYAPIGYGPIDDGSGNADSKKHFARSAYVTRSQAAQLGHSQRSAHSLSIDVFVNRTTGTHRAADLWHVLLGVNDGSTSTWDYSDELLRLAEYVVQERRGFDGVTPHFVLYTEPQTGSTTNGILQRMLRSRNRDLSVVVRQLRALGCQVRLVDLNERTHDTLTTYTASGSFTVPAWCTRITVEAWGGGGGGGGASVNGGGGGGGGAFARKLLTVTPGAVLTVTVGGGGAVDAAGGDSWVVDAASVLAKGGSAGGAGSAGGQGAVGAGGSSGASIGDVVRAGGDGGGGGGADVEGGGGGGGAGYAGVGGNGAASGTAGTGTAQSGGNGGAGATAASAATASSTVGGGGGGASTTQAGSAGSRGEVRIWSQ